MHRPLEIALAISTLAALMLTWTISRQLTAIDFFQFRGVARVLWHVGDPGHADIYSDEGRKSLAMRYRRAAACPAASKKLRVAAHFRTRFETYSTPLLYFVFGLFSLTHFDADLEFYRFICLACFVLSVFGLCKLLRYSRATSMGAVLLFALAYEPLAADLRVGNVNSLQLAFLTAFLWLRHRAGSERERTGGGVLGVACMFKPNLAIVVGILMIARLFRGEFSSLRKEATGMALAGALSFGFSSWLFGSPFSWLDWVGALQSLPDRIITLDLGNYSLAEVLHPLVGQTLSGWLWGLTLGATGVALWKSRSHRSREADVPHDLAVVAIGCMVLLLAPRLVWLHYYVLATPAVLYLLRPGQALPLRLAAGAAATAIAFRPLFLLGMVSSAAIDAAIIVCGGASVLFALGLGSLGWPSGSSPAMQIEANETRPLA